MMTPGDLPENPGGDGNMMYSLQIINDHVYDRSWLLNNADRINSVIRATVNRGLYYHYAVDTLMNILPVMLTSSEFQPWRHRLIEALVFAQDLGDKDLLARLSIALARYHNLIGEPTSAHALLLRAQGYADQRNEDYLLESYAGLIETYILAPHPRFDAAQFGEALEIAARSEREDLKAMIHQMIAVAHIHRQEMDLARNHVTLSAEIAVRLQEQNLLLRSLLIQATLLRQLGDWQASAEVLRRARETYPKTNHLPKNYVLLCYEEGCVQLELDQPAEALDRFREAVLHIGGRENAYDTGLCYVGLALACLKLRLMDEAAEAIEEAHSIWEYLGNAYMMAHATYTRAFIEMERSVETHRFASQLFRRALEAAAKVERHAAREQLERLILEKIALLDYPPD
ncbi:MAG: hypothetical protein JNL42_02480 [Anaerolineae bacterium]|nr:hypothetical protein [Anaerolineae bacterium]